MSESKGPESFNVDQAKALLADIGESASPDVYITGSFAIYLLAKCAVENGFDELAKCTDEVAKCAAENGFDKYSEAMDLVRPNDIDLYFSEKPTWVRRNHDIPGFVQSAICDKNATYRRIDDRWPHKFDVVYPRSESKYSPAHVAYKSVRLYTPTRNSIEELEDKKLKKGFSMEEREFKARHFLTVSFSDKDECRRVFGENFAMRTQRTDEDRDMGLPKRSLFGGSSTRSFASPRKTPERTPTQKRKSPEDMDEELDDGVYATPSRKLRRHFTFGTPTKPAESYPGGVAVKGGVVFGSVETAGGYTWLPIT